MLSKVDLRDFFEINQGLYEPVPTAHPWLAQAFGLAADTTAAALPRDAHTREHTTKR